MRRLGGPSRGEHSRALVPIRKEIAMFVTRTRMVVLIGVSLYVAVMVFAGGVAAERRLEDASPVAADAIPADAIPVVWS
jgi:hypothetical protein